VTTTPAETNGRGEEGPGALRDAYALLRRAASELGATAERAVRDSDVKRRMLDFDPDWDESSVGFSKFSRFLRQAHDAEVINLRKIDSGNYEVALPGAAVADTPDDRGGRRGGEGRGRRGRRDEHEERPSRADSTQAEVNEATVASAPEAAKKAEPAPAVEPAAKTEPAAASQPAAKAPPVGLRRGSRAPKPASAPLLLEGQVVTTSRTTAPSAPPAQPAPSQERAKEPSRPPSRVASTLSGLGLPTERAAVIEYLTKSYKGIGTKTAESLVDAVGAANVFATLQDAPDRVKEIVGAKRGDTLIEAWQDDIAHRRANASPLSTSAASSPAKPSRPRGGGGDKPNGNRRGRRRGGRGRKRPAPSA
jgi:hypothetical protein